jgi:hypothetical protein
MPNMPKFRLFSSGLLAVVLLSVLLTACAYPQPGVATDSQEQPAQIDELSGSSPVLPPGSYSTMLKPIDFNFEYIAALPALRNYFGLWVLQLTNQSRFSLNLNNHQVVEGEYQFSSDQIYFNNSSEWPSLCADDQEEAATVAIYNWRLEGQNLELSGSHLVCSVKDLVFSQVLEFSAPPKNLDFGIIP